MQRLTMLPAATLLTTGCGSKQDDAARVEADRTVPAAGRDRAGGNKPFLDEHDLGKVSDDRVGPDSGTILHRSDAPSADAEPRSTRKPTAGSPTRSSGPSRAAGR